MRFALLLALFLTGSASAAATSPGLPPGPYVVINDHFYVRPSFTFELSSAQQNMMIGRTHWRTWAASGATATTTLFTNTCLPSCSEGSFREQAARVELFGLGSCHGKKVFSEFEILDAAGARLLTGTFRGLGYLRHC